MHELAASWLLSVAALASYLFHHLQLLWAEASDLHLGEHCKPKPPAQTHSQIRAGGLLHSFLIEVWDGGHLIEWDLGSWHVEHSDLELLRS